MVRHGGSGLSGPAQPAHPRGCRPCRNGADDAGRAVTALPRLPHRMLKTVPERDAASAARRNAEGDNLNAPTYRPSQNDFAARVNAVMEATGSQRANVPRVAVSTLSDIGGQTCKADLRSGRCRALETPTSRESETVSPKPITGLHRWRLAFQCANQRGTIKRA
jgi:hypothetical protein